MVVDSDGDVDVVDDSKWSVLYCASLNTGVDCVKFVLKENWDVTVETSAGGRP